MDFSLPPEVESFRAELRTWLSRNLSDEIVAAGRRGPGDDAAFAVIRAWTARMADAGWAAVSWPREYGGRGAGVLEQLVWTEETTRARAPLPVNVIGMNNIAPAIMIYGTPEQKGGLLPRMLRGDDIWCQGMSEPGAGSDLASLRTRATRDGDDFVIDGQKLWTSLGHRADWCQLFVRTDPEAPRHKGISCLLVPMRHPKIEARPLVTLTGGSDFAEVFFDGARVPATQLLGPLNQGWAVATTTLSNERAGAARLYAELEGRLADLEADLPGPVRDDPATRARLGELDVRIAFLKALCLRSISAGLHGGDAFATAGLAKTVWGETGQLLAETAFDLVGDTERWARYRLDARSLTIAGGTTQVTKNATATRVLGLPR